MSNQSQDSLSSGQTPYDPKQDSEYLTIDKERPLSTLNRSTVIPDLESASPDNFQDAKETPSSNLMGSFDQNTRSAAMDRQPIVTIFDVASDIEKMLQDLKTQTENNDKQIEQKIEKITKQLDSMSRASK